ncbi:hypothetical protein [Natrinema sp. DC36]|uniref:hypothetical protein n=1 Tax=Natrinema sp. DC36 TaxID=2878680 RepID=UPI001CF067BA|nr:hypothetical protein [Natrinema sp. DC36]
MNEPHDSEETRIEQPETDVKGNRIEYVYVVYRPAANSDLGRCEILGVHKSEESAESHREAASLMGDCEIEEKDLKPHGDWNAQ